jgi:hypothetical protein
MKADRKVLIGFVRDTILSQKANAAIILLPDRQPMRRDAYLAINAVAYRLLGKGGFHLTAPRGDNYALLSWNHHG